LGYCNACQAGSAKCNPLAKAAIDYWLESGTIGRIKIVNPKNSVIFAGVFNIVK
jgi:hypothetical protein